MDNIMKTEMFITNTLEEKQKYICMSLIIGNMQNVYVDICIEVLCRNNLIHLFFGHAYEDEG